MPEKIVIVYCTKGDFHERAPESQMNRLMELTNQHIRESGHSSFRWGSEDEALTFQMEELRKNRL